MSSLLTHSRANARFATVGEMMVPISISESVEAEASAWKMCADDLYAGIKTQNTILLYGALADYESLKETYGKP